MLTKFTLAAVPVFATESCLRGRASDDAALDYGAGGGFAAACQATVARAALLKPSSRPLVPPAQSPDALRAALPRPPRSWDGSSSLETSQHRDGRARGGVTRRRATTPTTSPCPRDVGGVHLGGAPPRCSAAAVATAIAVAVMVYWSFAAGDPTTSETPRRASRAVKTPTGGYRPTGPSREEKTRQTTRAAKRRANRTKRTPAEVTQVEVTIRAESEAKDDEREAKHVDGDARAGRRKIRFICLYLRRWSFRFSRV